MSSSTFFTNEAVSLERHVDLNCDEDDVFWEEKDREEDVRACACWIKKNNYRKVCLQFPDRLLNYSGEVALELKKDVGETEVYVMADTTYESCCIDYVTSAHINADAIIHFGSKCLSEATNELPCLYISPKARLKVRSLLEAARKTITDDRSVVFLLDSPYVHYKDEFLKEEEFLKRNYKVRTILEEKFYLESLDDTVVFVTRNQRKLMHFYFAYNCSNLYYYNEKVTTENTSTENTCTGQNNTSTIQNSTDLLSLYRPSNRIVSRRNFLAEKIKDSKTIGILVGTLAVKHYIKVIDRIKKLVTLHGKKYYVIHVGKPSVAKLANFPEIELYVLITCPMSEVFESRDFYQPIVTPFDVEMALNPDAAKQIGFNPTCSAFVDEKIPETISNEGDVSLITGQVRYREEEDRHKKDQEESHKSQEKDNEEVKDVVKRDDGILVENRHFGAGFLGERSWQGLEQNLGQTEVVLAEEGIKGVAQQYDNEGG